MIKFSVKLSENDSNRTDHDNLVAFNEVIWEILDWLEEYSFTVLCKFDKNVDNLSKTW